MVNVKELEATLKLSKHILSVKRINVNKSEDIQIEKCALKALHKANEGKQVIVTTDNVPCYGAITGFGFVDGLPKTPGGYGHFISNGRGEGYPKGEKVKSCPKIAEKMLLSQPQKVMEGFNAIQIKLCEDNELKDLVIFIANPDQISALIHLFNFNNYMYDNVIAPMTSGCASIFRIPFGELNKKDPKAVIGNIDIGSRIFFESNLFIFVVTGKVFNDMLKYADDCFFKTENWKRLRDRN